MPGLGTTISLTFLAGEGNRIVLQILARYQTLFLASGQNIFLGLALILIVWHGIETALGGIDRVRTARFLLFISFAFAMIHYYSAPIPGIGYSFTDLIIKEPAALADTLDFHGMDLMQEHMKQVQARIPVPSMFNPHYMLIYCGLQFVGALVAVMALFVVIYGAIGQAVCLILGPLFLPWFLVPKLDFLFWSWLRSLLQFSFYQLVAAIVCQLVARLLVTLLDPTTISGDWSDLMFAWPFIAGVQIVAIFTLYKIPAITNSLFTGASAGDSGALQAMTGAAKGAVAS